MVKIYHVMNYIKDSIEDNIMLNEEGGSHTGSRA